MNQRQARRFPKRLNVRFWRRGDPQAHQGFTTNVSIGGLFLGTGAPLAVGERLRLEIVDRDRGFVVEAIVVRVHRVSVALRQVAQPGVGLRFLTPAELLMDMLPAAFAVAKEGEPAASAPPQEVEILADGEVSVRFNTLEALEKVWSRDLAHGGMFIQTAQPFPVDRELMIEIHVPSRDFKPLRAAARVIHSFTPPKEAGEGQNLLSGMGVVFLDPAPVVAAVGEVIARYRS